ncbi:hypothetical protein B0H14DRAFT_2164867, partial [Mycena olivaceomarginata]
FLEVFAAWLLEDNLPFTTGETGGIHPLFRFMDVRYNLPCDTTMCNTLARMFANMYNALKEDLKARHLDHSFHDFYFAGTIGSWITEEWELVEHVHDFHAIEDKEHEG